MSITVLPNKNIALIFSLLNRFELVPEDKNNPIKTKTIEHFKNYVGEKPELEKYIHSSKLVSWALSVNEAPIFEQIRKLDDKYQWEFNKGSYIKPFAIDFYNKTDFEDFYNNYLLNVINKMKAKMEEAIASVEVEKILDETWGTSGNTEMVIVPNPLTYEGFGPRIENVNYQVISAIHRDKVLHKIFHEGSHPRAKSLLIQYSEAIEKLSPLLNKVMGDSNYPNAYNTWGTCFEEHLIRATQIALLNPKVIENYDEIKAINEQEKDLGMLFIKTFYNEIKDKGLIKGLPEILNELGKIE